MKGILIGLIFGVPAGAIGTLTIKRTIAHGTAAGLFSGAGCSIAELLYSCVSVFGLTVISDFMLRYQSVISVAGGLFIVGMGLGIMLKKQTVNQKSASPSRLVSFFTSSFLIAITNPATILSFLIAFSIFQIGTVTNIYHGVGLVAGIFGGTCIWWFLITILVRFFRSQITNSRLKLINLSLGGLVLLFGALVIIRTVI